MSLTDILNTSEVTPGQISDQVAELYGRERELLRRLGLARLQGVPDQEIRSQLRDLREELESLHAAHHLLELAGRERIHL